MKGKKILVILCVLFVVLVLGIFLYIRNNDTSKTETGLKSVTYDECAEMNGEIINTPEDKRVFPDEDILGEVEGLRCPCVCVKKGNNAGFFLSE